MSDYRVQLKDELGDRQFPITTTQCVVDEEGKSLDAILATIGGGSGLQHIVERTVYITKMVSSSDSLASEFDSDPLGVLEEDIEITDEQRAYNLETLKKIEGGESVVLFVDGRSYNHVGDTYQDELMIESLYMLSLYPFNFSITLNANGDVIYVIEDVQISGGNVDIDPELLESYMLITRDFSDDFNDDFAR